MPRRSRQKPRLRRLFGRAERYLRCRDWRRLFDLLERCPELLSHVDDGEVLLILAGWGRHYHVVAWMLAHGADPDLAEPGCNTPLIHAACENDVRLVTMLLDAGADIEKPNEHLETPLGYACAWDAVDVVRLLCERGADVNGTEQWGYSYLSGVQGERERAVAKALAAPDDAAASALAAKQIEIERILLAHGAIVIRPPVR